MNGLVEFIDIFPTLCRLCSLPIPGNLPGEDITRSGFKGKKYAVSQFVRPYSSITKPENKTHTGYAISSRRWTYVEWIDLAGNVTDRELYRKGKDMTEKKNLIGKSLFRRRTKVLSSALHRIAEI